MTQPLTDEQRLATPTPLGLQVRLVRRQLGLSQTRLAELAHTSREVVRRVERGYLKRGDCKAEEFLRRMSTLSPSDLPSRMEAFRARRGLSQFEAARLAGVNFRTWRNVEYRWLPRWPTDATVAKIERVLCDEA